VSFGTAHLAGSDHLLADLKEQSAIASFAIGEKGQILGLFNHLAEGLHSIFEQVGLTWPTFQFPDETAGAIHQDNSPTFRSKRWLILAYFRVQLIPFNQLLDELMTQGVQQ